jgi:hypothetical protein
VRRTSPPAPATPPDSERVFASRADYHSRSFYTYRWVPSAGLKTHVFRALDDTLFQTDWKRRAADNAGLDPDQAQLFPAEWDAPKRAQVADELNQLNTFGHDADKAAAFVVYRALSNDALRALAALPGNERAFTQLTIGPLDPDDPANANRLGPDDASGFVIDPALRAYTDTLDGRSSNRYFYRAAYVDAAHNRGPLSLASPPVYCPKVVPPRAPVITRVLGGERQIGLSWASNREPDLVEYRLYRADSEPLARDIRLMTLVHTEPAGPGDPQARPAQLNWTDAAVESLKDHYYRLVAVDAAQNVSMPSGVAGGRAYDYSPPLEPTWIRSERVKLDEAGNEHAWSDPQDGLVPAVAFTFTTAQARVAALVERQVGAAWQAATSWLRDPEYDSAGDRWRYRAYDRRADPAQENVYRAKLMSSAGVVLESVATRTVPAQP